MKKSNGLKGNFKALALTLFSALIMAACNKQPTPEPTNGHTVDTVYWVPRTHPHWTPSQEELDEKCKWSNIDTVVLVLLEWNDSTNTPCPVGVPIDLRRYLSHCIQTGCGDIEWAAEKYPNLKFYGKCLLSAIVSDPADVYEWGDGVTYQEMVEKMAARGVYFYVPTAEKEAPLDKAMEQFSKAKMTFPAAAKKEQAK
jgi:hypothetical protein